MRRIGIWCVCFFLFFCIVGCTVQQQKFALEKEYYETSELVELDLNTYEKLVKEKKSFLLFIYQPLCVTSDTFEKIVKEFSSTYQLTIYQMPFSLVKESNLEKIQYYPSFVIFHEGEVVDFLEADKEEDKDQYKNLDALYNWVTNYVTIEEGSQTVNSETTEEENQKEIENIDLQDVEYNSEKVNIYFFWGNGCPHCEEEFAFFNKIEKEYGEYYNLNTFEVWYDEKNEKILKSFAQKMNDQISGVPYTIIGNQSYIGFGEEEKEEMIDAIISQHKNSYDVYFDLLEEK